MPRRIFTYPAVAHLSVLNAAATWGAAIMAVGVLLFALNVVVTMRSRERAGNDPWDAYTLEWATTSPPPEFNFTSLPPIRSERPWFDAKYGKAPS